MRMRASSFPSLQAVLFVVLFVAWPVGLSASPFAYITNFNSGTVSVIDTATDTVVATIPVGNRPFSAAVNPAGTRVYVTNLGDSTVSVIDPRSNTVIATVGVGPGPIGIAISPGGTRVYVGNNAGGFNNSISVIDAVSNTVIDTILVGFSPGGMATNPAGTRLYVANDPQSTLSVIDTSNNSVIATVPLSASRRLSGVVVAPDGTRAYIAGPEGHLVHVLDTASNTVVGEIAVGGNGEALALNPAGTRLYVAETFGASQVEVIDTTTSSVVAVVPVVSDPRSVGVNPSGTRVYATNPDTNTVSVIDTATNTVVHTITNVCCGFSFGPQFIGPAAPILFVHGWCGDAAGWEPMIEALQARDPATYGPPGTAALLYYDYRPRFNAIIPQRYSPDTRIVALELTNSACQKSVCDFQQLGDQIEVAQTSIRDKAFQLKEAIAFVKQRSGAAKVIVVGHSQGGLVARAYVQGLATKDASIPDETTPYENDVERIVTIDTPHAGAPLAKINWNRFPACFAVDTVSKQEMEVSPGNCRVGSVRPECFLAELNTKPMPPAVRLFSIASRYPKNTPVLTSIFGEGCIPLPETVTGLNMELNTYLCASDAVVPYSSQNMKDPSLPYATVTQVVGQDNLVNTLDPRLHVVVKERTETTELVDRDLVGVPPQMSVNDILVSAGGFPFTFVDAQFTVRLSAASSEPVEITYTTLESTARENADFRRRSGSLRFEPGTTEQIVTVPVRRGFATGSVRIFYVQLFFPTNAVLARGLGKATIFR